MLLPHCAGCCLSYILPLLLPAAPCPEDVRQKLIESSNPPRLAYLATLEQSAPDRRMLDNCRPSLLQAKLKSGQNRCRQTGGGCPAVPVLYGIPSLHVLLSI